MPLFVELLIRGQPAGSLMLEKDFSAWTEEMRRHVYISLSYDASCNLSCPSCRNEKHLLSKQNLPNEIMSVHKAFLRSLDELLGAGYFVRLSLTGSGDPFASPLYFDFLKNLKFHPRLTLELQTNGVLMDETRFSENIMRMVKRIYVSVDAASKDTYDKVRVGGAFERLKKNIAWLDEVRSAGLLPKMAWLKAIMVVQKDNYREMGQFVDWLTEYRSIDEIYFSKILDWGHLPAQVFFEKAVWMGSHPEYRGFLESLQDPSLRHERVNLGNLSSYLSASS